MNVLRHVARLLALTVYGLAFAGEPILRLPEDEEIRMALEAGPQHLRAAATVYVFGDAGYRKVREGTNGFTCLVNRDGNQAGDKDLKPTCWDAEGSRTIVPVMLYVGEQIAKSASPEEIKRRVESGFASGRFSSPTRTGIAYMLLGDVGVDPQTQRVTRTLFPPHYMIYAPGVTNADIGVAQSSAAGAYALPSVYAGYSGGARTAYIIVLAPPRPATPSEHQH
jgi:hypothetical protein